jgi:Holliday junction resolvasome RuvABC endonuclease subunit
MDEAVRVPSAPTLYIGVDPGFAYVGIMRFTYSRSRGKLVYADSFQIDTTKVKPKKDPRRWDLITRELYDWIVPKKTVLVAIEDQAGVFAAKKKAGMTTIDSAKCFQCVSSIRSIAHLAGSEIDEVPPVSARKMLGLPRGATKSQCAAMLKRLTLGVPDGLSEHEYDAGVMIYVSWRRNRWAGQS